MGRGRGTSRASRWWAPSRALWLLLALASLAHLAVVALTPGAPFDLGNAEHVGRLLRGDPLDVYGVEPGTPLAWPYPPGWFPVVLFAGELAAVADVAFTTTFRVLGSSADIVLAWLVWIGLAGRGLGERERLAAAGLVAVGPAFLAITAIHGQIDAAAMVPAVAAVVLFERLDDHPRRALYAGLLIGVAGAVKTVPLVFALALIPLMRSPREGLTCLAAAAAVPLALLAPFLVADAGGVVESLRYNGAAGVGGLGLVVQPDLAVGWLSTGDIDYSKLTDALQAAAFPLTVAAVASVAVLLLKARAPVAVGASLIVLALWVFGVNFFLQYALWGLPFMLLAGWWRTVLLLEAIYCVPLAIRYGSLVFDGPPPSEAVVRWIYVPTMVGLWAAALIALVVIGRRAWRAGAARRALRGDVTAVEVRG